MSDERIYNVNVGVLGHVDSGKTSLVAALSTTLSTAALDKHPQSKERGITLDLGFSSFTVPAPDAVRAAGFPTMQFTLVDCPGHASLIRTVIGGAQIIDMMILVVDITKGIQPQTAECIVIGELTTRDLVVVLNKIAVLVDAPIAPVHEMFADSISAAREQIPEAKREKTVAKAKKLVAQTLAATAFAGSPMVAVAARPGTTSTESGPTAAATGIPDLVDALLSRVMVRERGGSGPFLFYIDHCFAIKGQGTVLTGTVVRGSLRVNAPLELPELKLEKKVRSMQMFRRPVAACGEGDRVGICVTQLDPKLIERGVACAPGTVPTFGAAIAAVDKVRFYAGEVRSRSKLHVTVGHTTVVAEVLFFGVPDGQGGPQAQALPALQERLSQLSLKSPSDDSPLGHLQGFDFGRDYLYQECLYGLEGRPWSSGTPGQQQQQQQQQYSTREEGSAEEGDQGAHHGPQWAYLRFSQPVTAPADSLVIGSRLDADLQAASCRLAFYGRLSCMLDPSAPAQLLDLRVFKPKQREGVVERVEGDGCTAICRGMFKKDTDLSRFTGMRVTAVATGQEGRIEGGFGKSGKFKVYFPGGIAVDPGSQTAAIALRFKKYLFDTDKKHMAQ